MSNSLLSAVRAGNFTEVVTLINSGEPLSDALLFEAVRMNRVAILAYLTGRGANIDARDDRGNTPLHHAVVRGRPVICGYLLEIGAEVARNRKGETPVDLIPSSFNLSDIEKAWVASLFRKVWTVRRPFSENKS